MADETRMRRAALWYPRLKPEEAGRAGDTIVDTVHVDLVDVRAARDIRITYDFDRDGFVISAQDDPGDGKGYGLDEQGNERAYVEKAFVPAWEEPPEVEQCPRHFLPDDGGHSPMYRDGHGSCGYCGKAPPPNPA